MTIETSIDIIKIILKNLGIDPTSIQLLNSNGHGWAIPTEKSILILNIGEIDGQTTIRLTCPILFMPSQDLLPFYRKMLDLNSELADFFIAMDRDIVCLVNQQAIDGLNPIAIENLINRIRKSSNVIADIIIQEFNSARYWSPL